MSFGDVFDAKILFPIMAQENPANAHTWIIKGDELPVIRHACSLQLLQERVEAVQIALRQEMPRKPRAKIFQCREQGEIHAKTAEASGGGAIAEQKMVALVVDCAVEAAREPRQEDLEVAEGNGLIGDVRSRRQLMKTMANPQVQPFLDSAKRHWAVAPIDGADNATDQERIRLGGIVQQFLKLLGVGRFQRKGLGTPRVLEVEQAFKIRKSVRGQVAQG